MRPGRPFGKPKRVVDHLHLASRRRVVGVDLRRLEVGMAEVLLDRAQRHAGRGEGGGEGMAEVLKADRMYAGLLAGALEAARDLRAVPRYAQLGMGEYEVVVVAEDGE